MTMQKTLLIPANHPAFAGHFPGTPIVPGVVLLDAVMQHVTHTTGFAASAWQITTVKFMSPLKPDESVVITMTPLANGNIKFEIRTEHRQIVAGSLTLKTAGHTA